MSEGKLFITDSRTSHHYQIPIQDNAIDATSFKAIKGHAHGSRQAQAGLRVYDQGLQNTAVGKSGLTYIDGARGVICYRGKAIEDLWKTSEFEDMVYLFVWGHLPSAEEKEKLKRDFAAAARDVPASVISAIQSFPCSSKPIPMVIAGLSAYLACDSSSQPTHTAGNIYHGNFKIVDKAIVKTLAAYSVVIGLAVSHRASRPFKTADPNGSWLSNLLLMMGFVDPGTGKPNPKHIAAIQRTWVLSADHGSTNSTSALLLTASTLADPLSCLISSIAAGYGPLHFGATEVAYKNIADVGGKEHVPALIEEIKAGRRRLFGYGHRTYKNVDPRVEFAKEILEDLGAASNPLLGVAMEIDRVASTDQYFISRDLHANADLYGVFIFIALDLPPELVPVLMMASRSPGLMGHWREAMGQPVCVWRPQQIYTGPTSDKIANAKL